MEIWYRSRVVWGVILILFYKTYLLNSVITFRGNDTGKLSRSDESANIEGDIILGGLFPVHQKGDDGAECGAINIQRGVQRLEAMLFTVDRINADPKVLPGIDLGAEVFDTCSRGTYALERSLEFIRASFANLDSADFKCDDGSEAKANATPRAIAGVIGGSYSSVSIQVANLLRLFKLPQISYASTSADLSDKKRYDYFVRTVPPDGFQAKAMADIVQLFNWTYVSTVASEGDYGQSGIESFQNEARSRNICISISIKIISNSNQETFDTAIEDLDSKKNAMIVVLFLRVEDARNLLLAAKRKKLYHRFTWIASDGWGMQDKPVLGNEDIAEGAMTIELDSTLIPEFDTYFLKLKPETNTRNPWFKEYWETVHECKFRGKSSKAVTGQEFKKNCTGQEKKLDVYQQETKVQFIYNAVYAMALSLDRMQRDVCPGTTKLCENMKKIDGERLLKEYILNTSFSDDYGAMVQFDSKGDALGRYRIMNYQKNPKTERYEYVVVGNWSMSLQLDVDRLVWSSGTAGVPESRCSEPCNFDQYKYIGKSGDSCCWVCITCQDFEYLKDEFTCEDCGRGRWPNSDKRDCHVLPKQYMQWDSVYSLVPMVLACVGLIATLVVILTFMKFHDTPVVMASGRELSYFLLSGCLMCYFITFILIAKPSTIMCAIQRFGVGFGFSVIYSSLLTKTNRISRIFDSARRSARRPPFISPKSQIVITCILILIQVLFTIVWLVIEPPGTRIYLPNGKRNEVILKCKTDDISFLVSLMYNMLLIIVCTLYAIKTRKIPENFNESKFIGFAMYTTCIIWLAFVPIYFGTLNSFQVQITTLCISISLSATVALLCLFTPKMYIIVFQPEKNVRRLTMNSASYNKKPQTTTSSILTNNHDAFSERIKLSVNYDQKFGVTTTAEKDDKEKDVPASSL
ncbi:metabotropic glutamate receptor-like [Ylistrum balloti]|uniref:metabotropic glutamate receptor-like n=1 Tax=Ylistrum balloti TaxID=509963 RepID=UPI0029059C21|nr:metabotropic glutamate receptor-like [Ylistrum balloti]